jgi:hypothetical protein
MDRCDREIATWSSSGDNFVVKDVEQFSTKVLPLYFKHSNFSSFGRYTVVVTMTKRWWKHNIV